MSHTDLAMEESIRTCLDCSSTCLRTLAHCLEKGGDHARPEHVAHLLDCADLCRTAADLMARGSALHQQTCALCAEACARCAESCEALAADDEELRRCAEMCRRRERPEGGRVGTGGVCSVDPG